MREMPRDRNPCTVEIQEIVITGREGPYWGRVETFGRHACAISYLVDLGQTNYTAPIIATKTMPATCQG
jgi:hypothetical protein